MNSDDEDEHKFVEAAFARVAASATPILERQLAELGLPMEALPRAQQFELLKVSMIEATAGQNPNADFDQMRRIFDLMADTRFTSAFSRLRAAPYEGAFGLAQGIDAAIVLTGANLPIAPLDRKTGRIIGPLIKGIDGAERIFSKVKTAMVGYAPAQASFYLLTTDCMLTAYDLIQHDPFFAPLKTTLTGPNGFPIAPNVPKFRHGMIFAARQDGDRLETRAIEDANPNRGSIMLYAGWMEDDDHKGVPNDGILPVPAQLLRKLVEDPSVLQWLSRPAGSLMATLH